MRFLIVSASLLLSGCTGMLIGNALNQGQNLTPDQVKAYNDVGQNVYGCLNISGPPPIGGATWLFFPKSETPNVSFLPNCMIQMK